MADSTDKRPDLLLRYRRLEPWTILAFDCAIINAKILPWKETSFYHCWTEDDSDEVHISAIRGGHRTSGQGLLYKVLMNLKSDLGYPLEDVQLSSEREVYIKPAFYGWYKDDPWQKVIKIARETLSQEFKVVIEGYPSLDD